MNGRTPTALPESMLVEHHGAELADAAGRHDVVGDARREEVGVARERRAARRGGAEQNLICLQRRRLEHDGGAVRQRPLGDARSGRGVVLTIVPRAGGASISASPAAAST